MSVQMQTTKRRINSIVATRKITNAMELIAVTKLNRWKRHMFSSEQFSRNMCDILCNIVLRHQHLDNKYMYENEKAKGDLHIILTSNLGLCGAYNNNILQYAIPKIKENDTVVIVGRRGYRAIKRENLNLVTDYIEVGDKLSYDHIKSLGRFVVSRFNLGLDRKILVHYTKFITSLKSETLTEQLLPLENIAQHQKNEAPEVLMIIEPGHNEFLNEFIPLYINGLLLNIFVNAQVSEQSARRNAMETATDNATELIDELTIQYNTARQAAITQEITEVIGGA